MWTAENRARYKRRGLRYPSDLTDAEWELVAPHIRPAVQGGDKPGQWSVGLVLMRAE